MDGPFELVFDEIMIKQLKKAATKKDIRDVLSRMLDKLEVTGARAGKLLDSQLHIYEIKNKKPPIRLYFKTVANSQEIYVFEFEMKSSTEQQKKTINRLREKLKP